MQVIIKKYYISNYYNQILYKYRTKKTITKKERDYYEKEIT
ncbi:hypothetical protein CNEO3_280035 [Clostridium neonatale]|nr:hypothetical protein CNEO3_280035 [Clostridium neonatale]CAI3650199.1 hypothetical protein CNEO4_390007 [Clostridium neonatale]